MSITTRRYFYFLLILAAGITLRLFHLDYSDFWYDEMISLHFAKDPSWTSIFWDNTPFLYNAILKAWVNHWGMGEGMTRLLSVFFSLGTLTLFYFLWSPRAAVIYLCSAFSLYYAREVRVYAMFEFFTTLSLLVFLRGKSDRRLFFSFIPFLLSHYFSIFQVLSVSLWKFWMQKQKKFLYFFLFAGAVLSTMFFTVVSWESISWMRLRFRLEPFSGFPHFAIHELFFSSIALSLVFAALILWDLRNWKKLNETTRFLIFHMLLCIAALTAASFVTQSSLLIPRYLIFLVPSIVIYADQKLAQIKNKKTLLLTYSVAITLAAFPIVKVYERNKSPWSAAADLVATSKNAAVFTTRSLGISTPYFDRRNLLIKKWVIGPEGMQQFEQALAENRDVWLIETYWSSVRYMGNLSEVLKQRGFKTESHALMLEGAEPIMLLKIHAGH